MLYDEATFATLDADGDGTLDQEELIHFTRRSVPNLELTVDLLREGVSAAGGLHLDQAFRFDAATSIKSSFQPAKLITGAEELDMTSNGPAAANSQRQGFDLALNLKQFDTDNNDYLEERELKRFNAVGLMAARRQWRRQVVFRRNQGLHDCPSRGCLPSSARDADQS